MILRRLVLVLSIVFCGSLAAAAAAVAAGSGGGLPPGDYTFSSQSANAFFGSGKGGVVPQSSFSIFVNHGLNSFQADPGKGPAIVMQSTMVQFTEFDAKGGGGSGCFVIPDGDFVVSNNLQSASLHTTLTPDNMCQGVGKPVGTSSVAAPLGGGGGGLALPIKVDVTWTGAGVVSTLRDDFTFRCLNHQEDGSSTFHDSVGGTASGAIGATAGLITPDADVSSQDGALDIKGTVEPPCFGK